MATVCPRHNTKGITFQDYGSELALPCQIDPYFDQFGGYYAFWALLHRYLPNLYHHLDGPKYSTDTDLEHGSVDLSRLENMEEGIVQSIASEYKLEVAEVMSNQGMALPPDIVADCIREEPDKRPNIKKKYYSPVHGIVVKSIMRGDFKGTVEGRDLNEIIEGNWNGVPHWTIED